MHIKKTETLYTQNKFGKHDFHKNRE